MSHSSHACESTEGSDASLSSIVVTLLKYHKHMVSETGKLNHATYFSKPDKTLLSKRCRQACFCKNNFFLFFKTNHY